MVFLTHPDSILPDVEIGLRSVQNGVPADGNFVAQEGQERLVEQIRIDNVLVRAEGRVRLLANAGLLQAPDISPRPKGNAYGCEARYGSESHTLR